MESTYNSAQYIVNTIIIIFIVMIIIQIITNWNKDKELCERETQKQVLKKARWYSDSHEMLIQWSLCKWKISGNVGISSLVRGHF